ncbi:hypothetical protein CDCA_CDCA10G2891 [Cyanidium caldarium]|uniref:CCD97-like C-terminal domain-containing protein n=1 Tax=Cyanidium caldarium TaxID=2771 RepID=A0AAV9IXL9_CYACA|nr:hypothetical protein CDCA_CDCA10G2891 [Cyanidium caldarium]
MDSEQVVRKRVYRPLWKVLALRPSSAESRLSDSASRFSPSWTDAEYVSSVTLRNRLLSVLFPDRVAAVGKRTELAATTTTTTTAFVDAAAITQTASAPVFDSRACKWVVPGEPSALSMDIHEEDAWDDDSEDGEDGNAGRRSAPDAWAQGASWSARTATPIDADGDHTDRTTSDAAAASSRAPTADDPFVLSANERHLFEALWRREQLQQDLFEDGDKDPWEGGRWPVDLRGYV